MLSLLLLFAAAPQSIIPPMPPAPQRPTARMRLYGAPPFGCPSEFLTAQNPAMPSSGLTWREGGQPVGLYRLLDRRVNGCPAPIVVSYRVPGSDAVGRELTPATTGGRLPR